MDVLKEILQIIFTSSLSIAVLFVICKIAGQRQISQLSMFDYINGITIGSIAAELATDLEKWWQPLTATIVYGLITIFIYKLSAVSIYARRFINGHPYILFENGVFCKNNFRKAKININEFLAQARACGYIDLSSVQIALLETNGQISFIPFSSCQPVTCKDLNVVSENQLQIYNIISDGKIILENLKKCNFDISWLNGQLELHKFSNASEVFLATCDKHGNFSAYPYTD